MDKEQICAEMDRVRNDYRDLLDTATVAELRNPTDGTKWNNEQLLFHMLFGYLLVRNLRILVWGSLACPTTRPGGSPRSSTPAPARSTSSTTSAPCSVRALWDMRAWSGSWTACSAAFRASLRAQPERALDRGMHFPVGWDPYFTDYMTLRDIYHYPTQHYDHHRQQLTLTRARGPKSSPR